MMDEQTLELKEKTPEAFIKAYNALCAAWGFDIVGRVQSEPHGDILICKVVFEVVRRERDTNGT
jgi:hypothetical protein